MAWPLLALMAAGTAIKTASSMYGASQSIKMGKYQQKTLDYEAKYLRVAKKIEEEKIRGNVKKVISAQKAATAASGFAGGGTVDELAISTQIQGDLDIALLRQAGSIEQLRLDTMGLKARSEAHGIAAGLYTNVATNNVDTLLSAGSRHGWFKVK